MPPATSPDGPCVLVVGGAAGLATLARWRMRAPCRLPLQLSAASTRRAAAVDVEREASAPTDHKEKEWTSCPGCGPNARTVSEALEKTSDERLVELAERLAFRPLCDVTGRRVVVVDVATNVPVSARRPHEARAMAAEILASPYRSTHCLETVRREVTFTQDDSLRWRWRSTK